MRTRAFTSALAALLLAGIACGQATQPQPSLGASPDPAEVKGRALLDKMIQALGGDAYLNYTSRADKGRTYSFFRGNPKGESLQFVHQWQWPDKDRFEIAVSGGSFLSDWIVGMPPIEISKKTNVVAYVHNGDKGYEITYKGTAQEEKKQTFEFVRRRAHSLEVVLRQWLKQPGTLVFYSGTAIADRRLVEQVTIMNAQNDSVIISIDPDTFLPLRRIFTFRDEQNYKTDDIIAYANYRRVEGIMTPMSVVRMHDGEIVAQQFLSDVHYNVALPASQFEATVNYDPTAPPPKKK